MYPSVKEWLNIPATRMPLSSISGTGVKTFGPSVDFLCYPTGKVKTVTNSKGTEVVSNNQLYADGSVAFNEQDEVIFEGKQHAISAITTYYRDGVPDLKVLYL